MKLQGEPKKTVLLHFLVKNFQNFFFKITYKGCFQAIFEKNFENLSQKSAKVRFLAHPIEPLKNVSLQFFPTSVYISHVLSLTK